MVLGFHGCDRDVGMRVLNSADEHLLPSNNDYDWLGDGVYFWRNDPQRAYEWAEQSKKVRHPFVIGAIIDTGLCLDLSERNSILLLQRSYEDLKNALTLVGANIENSYKNNYPDEGGFKLVRRLDCAVIKNLHLMLSKQKVRYDTVIGYFQEGKEAFPGSSIMDRSHIQICVRNVSCIKGYFLPRID